MSTFKKQELNTVYFLTVMLCTVIIPSISVLLTIHFSEWDQVTLSLFGKWFIFSAVGVRLFVAGIKQAIDPAFTAKQIFQMEHQESYPVIRELGFANICFGLIGILSLFFPEWRTVSAFGSGLYFGIAGIQHVLTKPEGINEIIALVSDLFIFILLAVYFYFTISV